MLTVSPAARRRLKSALVTVTVLPVCVQVPFQPPACCCQLVGQAKVSVQPSIGFEPLLVMSMLATKPLPQLLVSVKRTPQELCGGAGVVTVTGGEGQDTRPAASRGRTLDG